MEDKRAIGAAENLLATRSSWR